METAGPAARPFRWASVTKLLVALAALDAVQRGLLDLDEPAGPPGSTIRHLLSHASGLAFDSDMIQAQPGRRRIYSNRGIEIVADLVAARSGQPFERLLADEICLPLGMAATRLEGSPAWGAVSPLGDLMNLAVELASPSLVDEGLLARGDEGGLSRPVRRAARVRPPGKLRLGPGLRDQGQQGAALDRVAELAADVRPLRALGELPVGGPRGRARLRRPRRPRLRRLGQAGLAEALR